MTISSFSSSLEEGEQLERRISSRLHAGSHLPKAATVHGPFAVFGLLPFRGAVDELEGTSCNAEAECRLPRIVLLLRLQSSACPPQGVPAVGAS